MTYVPERLENVKSIAEVYIIVGTAPVSLFVGNHWATGQLLLFDLA